MALTKSIVNKKDVEVSNLMVREEISGSIDVAPGNGAYIVSLFIDQYENPARAAFVETFSNAIDAVMRRRASEPGYKGRVFIDLPSSLNPQLVIRDEGVGMSLEEFVEAFTQLLNSLKRDDFSQIGGFGLGSKAPLAYCSAFTVRTVKDKRALVGTCSRQGATNGFVVSDQSDTDEDNGTTVSIPVSAEDVQADVFPKILKQYYNTIAPGVEVVVDGKPYYTNWQEEWFPYTEVVLDEDTQTTGTLYLRKGGSFDRGSFRHSWGGANGRVLEHIRWGSNLDQFLVHYVLQGCSYPIVNKERSQLNYEISGPLAVLELKPGVVDFTPSRDNIIRNERFEALAARAADTFEQAHSTRLSEWLLSQSTSALASFVKSATTGFNNWELVITPEEVKISISTKYTLTLPVDRFTTANGANYIRFLKEFESLDSYFLYKLEQSTGTNWSKRSSSSTHFFIDSMTTTIEELKTAFKNPSMSMKDEGAVADLILKHDEAGHPKVHDLYKAGKHLVVVENATQNLAKQMRLHRGKLLKDEDFANAFLFLKGEASEDFRREASLVLEEQDDFSITFTTAEDLLAQVDKVKKNATSVARPKTSTYSFWTVDALPHPKDFRTTNVDGEEVELNGEFKDLEVRSLAKDENTLFLFYPYPHRNSSSKPNDAILKNALRGIHNEGVQVEGRRLVCFCPSDLSSDHARILGHLDRTYGVGVGEKTGYFDVYGIFFAHKPSFRVQSLVHKWASVRALATPAPATYAVEETLSDDLEEAIVCYIKAGVNHSSSRVRNASLETIAAMADHLTHEGLRTLAIMLTQNTSDARGKSLAFYRDRIVAEYGEAFYDLVKVLPLYVKKVEQFCYAGSGGVLETFLTSHYQTSRFGEVALPDLFPLLTPVFEADFLKFEADFLKFMA